jgi:hypothetical protein
MSEAVSIPSSAPLASPDVIGGAGPEPLPAPRCPITFRAGTLADVPFLDQLQKMHSHMVGWMPTKQMEGKIAAGQVLIAESRGSGFGDRVSGQMPSPESQNPNPEARVGYCISQDQYNGRDDVGIIYQLNVLPLKQRNLIGASLIKEVFDRAAYGCRLFCCWCAQDIQANYFWESIGFLPLAFRTGSASKQRIHIFWQRRIRADDEVTPYWFPSMTKSGAIREDRLVLPIPHGTHWRDAKPIILPGMQQTAQPALPPKREKKPFVQKIQPVVSPSRFLKETPPGKAAVVTGGKIRYLDRGDYVPPPEPEKPKREARPRPKNDPKLIAAVRELRDRWLERVNTGGFILEAPCKYNLTRALAPPPVGAMPADHPRPGGRLALPNVAA